MDHLPLALMEPGAVLEPAALRHLQSCPRCRLEARELALLSAPGPKPEPEGLEEQRRQLSAILQQEIRHSLVASRSVHASCGTLEVLALVGSGPHGTVHRARTDQGREVALKVLHAPSSVFCERFDALAEIQHPHLVRLHRLDTTGEAPWFTMELLKPIDPQDLDADRLGLATLQLASALEALHQAGLTHGNLTWRNFMVRPDGDHVLTDAGLPPMASDAGQDRAVLEALLSGSHEGASGARSTSSSLPIQSSMLEDHTRLGPYEVLEPLGRGGMGVVYRARHEESGKEVALKTVAVERASTLAALRRECAALAEIQHPGIARMVDNGMSDAPPWYAMALIEGRSLRARMGASRPEPDPVEEPLDETPSGRWWKSELSETLEDADLDPLGGSIEQAVDPALLGVLAELCRTLAWLHGEGFVHGDLKPENVVVTPQGRPVILDFGLAMRAHVGMSREQLEWRTNMAGTLAYMSPEQTLGRELDARSDLYAIGCILYEVVVGEPPFTGFTAEDIIEGHRQKAPIPPSWKCAGLPAGLDSLILGLLAKEPAKRMGYALDVAAALVELGAPLPEEDPGPPVRPYVYKPRFIGRRDELKWLSGHLRNARQGGGLAFVEGAAGIGKTRLVLEVARMAERRGFRALAGDCLPAAAGTLQLAAPLRPFLPLLSKVSDRCRQEGPDTTERLLGSHGPLLRAFEPSLPAGLAPPPSEHQREQIFEALEHLLRAYLGNRPSLLALEDLHGSDELTAGFLCHFLRLQDPPPLLVVGTFRPEELAGCPPGVRRLLQEAMEGSPILSLAPLPEAQVARLVSEMLAIDNPPPALVKTLARTSEGNPTFVAETLRHAVAQGLWGRSATGRWQVDQANLEALELPSSLRELLSDRLDRLSTRARSLVELAAVLGRDLDLVLLDQITEPSRQPLAAALQEAQVGGVLEEAGPTRIRFTSHRMWEVALEAVSSESLVDLHRRTAEQLSTRNVDPGRLATHWEGAQQWDRAVSCYLEAAKAARWRMAWQDAETAARQALVIAPEGSLARLDARIALVSNALYYSGRFEEACSEALAGLAEARRLGVRDREAECCVWLGEILGTQGEMEEAERRIRQAVALYEEASDHHALALALAPLGNILIQLGRYQDALPIRQRTLAIYEEEGTALELADALGGLAAVVAYLGDIDQSISLFQRALVINEAHDNRRTVGSITGSLGLLHRFKGDLTKALSLYRQALEIQKKVGNDFGMSVCLSNAGIIWLDLADLEAAEKAFRRSIAVSERIQSRQRIAYGQSYLARVLLDMGRLEEAVALLAQAITSQEDQGQGRDLAVSLRFSSRFHRLARAVPREAETLARKAVALEESLDQPGRLGESHCALGHALLAQGGSAQACLEAGRDCLDKTVGYRTPLEEALQRLEAAQEAASAGRELQGGELPEHLAPALRARLDETGPLAPEEASP